jgi:hypothetical protein
MRALARASVSDTTPASPASTATMTEKTFGLVDEIRDRAYALEEGSRVGPHDEGLRAGEQ